MSDGMIIVVTIIIILLVVIIGLELDEKLNNQARYEELFWRIRDIRSDVFNMSSSVIYDTCYIQDWTVDTVYIDSFGREIKLRGNQ